MKRRQTCGYRRLGGRNFFILNLKRDDDCLSSGYHSRRFSCGWWIVEHRLFSQLKRNPRDLLFSFLFTQKWDGEKIGLRIFFSLLSSCVLWEIYLFLLLYLFLISAVRFESEPKELLRINCFTSVKIDDRLDSKIFDNKWKAINFTSANFSRFSLRINKTQTKPEDGKMFMNNNVMSVFQVTFSLRVETRRTRKVCINQFG